MRSEEIEVKKVYGFKDLIVWQKSFHLSKEVYRTALSFPKFEGYALAQQIRKSSLSVPSNIAEGYGRQSDKEYRQFLSIAYGSLCELETQYLLSVDFQYTVRNEIVEQLMTEVGKMLYKMVEAL